MNTTTNKSKKFKLLAVLFIAVAFFAGTIKIAPSSASAAAPVCYQQGDSRWANKYYGSWNVGESGCGLLATVNAVNYQTGNFIHPWELAEWGYANGYYNNPYQGTMRWQFYPNVTSAFGSRYGFSVSGCSGGSITSSSLINHLAGGGSAIVHVPNHFMAINAYNRTTGQYLVYDSAAGTKRGTSASGSWLTASQLNANAYTVVDWFCLVTRTGAAPSPSLYTVSAAVAKGVGSVHFGNGITSATVAPGTIVNFQTTPGNYYKVSKITINGVSQTVKNGGGDYVYQFSMPAQNTVVSVEFEQISAGTYTVSAVVAKGAGSVHFGNGITSATVAPGTIVNFQTTPGNYYKVSKITINGVSQTVKNGGGDCVYQFSMPAQNTVVSVEFVSIY